MFTAVAVAPALATLFTTALASEPTVVFAAPPVTDDTPEEYVTVGFDPTDGDGATWDSVHSTLGNGWTDEQGDVVCTVTVWSGDEDGAPQLARAGAIATLLHTALKGDPRLGGLLVNGSDDGSFARVLGRGSFKVTQTTGGATARLTFQVHYSSLLTG